jgi:hypothetical protein
MRALVQTFGVQTQQMDGSSTPLGWCMAFSAVANLPLPHHAFHVRDP